MDSDDAMKTLASVQMARDHATCGRHGAATALLMKVLQDVPQLSEELGSDLTFSLKAYGELLAGAGQLTNALWLYSQAFSLLPRPCGLHTNAGALQYSHGKAAASVKSFERALALDPEYWPALESLENVKSLAVDRWHFRMLNHSARNLAYARAIERVVAAAASDGGKSKAGVTVLDIGTGTGILAVMAARAGASKVYACEVNSVLCDIAREVVNRNGVADRVHIIHKSSGVLQPGVDLPEGGVDVIVTELVDSGLLGERIIPVLADARARGLLAKGGRVIPQGACVYAGILESETVRRRSRLLPGSPAGLSAATVRPTIEEPYTCEDLSRLDHRLLTSPTAVLEIDFLRDGANLMASLPSAAPEYSTTPSRVVPVELSGSADAVAVWFDLWLDEERTERDVVSTRHERSSRGDSSGWDAGIYFLSGTSVSDGDDVALGASAGRDRLHFTLHGDDGAVIDSTAGWAARGDAVGSVSGISEGLAGENSLENCNATSKANLNGAVGNGSGTGEGNSAVDDHSCGPCLLGEMDLARLNDGQFHLAHATAVVEALVARGVDTAIPCSWRSQTSTRNAAQASTNCPAQQRPVMILSAEMASVETAVAAPPPAFILDLCGAWGVAGLLVAQLERRDGSPATRVLAVAEGKEAAANLNALAKENRLGPDRYVATSDELIEFISRGAVAESMESGTSGLDASDHCLEAVPGGRNCFWPGHDNGFEWAVVMGSSLVEGSGLLKQGGLGDVELCRHLFRDGAGIGGNEASPGITFVPGHLEVVCRGLQRDSLVSENRVQYDSCCGVDVEPVNAFSVANFRELDLSAAVRSELDADGGESGGIGTNMQESCCGRGAITTWAGGDNGDVGTMQQNCGGEATTTRTAVSKCLDEGAAVSEGLDGGEQGLATRTVVSRCLSEGQEGFLTPSAVCYSLDLANVKAGPDGCLPRRSARLLVHRNGTLHAIAYWYRQRLGPAAAGARGEKCAAVLDTGPTPREGDDWSSSHFRQAAVLLKEPIVVTAGQSIELCVFCNTSKGVVVEVLGIAD